MPSSWLRGREVELYIMLYQKDGQPCLRVMPQKTFEAVAQNIQDLEGPTPKQKRDMVEIFYNAARSLSLDSQGRILLPDDYCSIASLKKEVVLTGSKDRFEIWDKKIQAISLKQKQSSLLEIADLIGL
ncbi:MAG: division/cell wall cluster transcriptional repressor MraZ [Chthoniobacterales bacterium]